jgi:hypothetical protein
MPGAMLGPTVRARPMRAVRTITLRRLTVRRLGIAARSAWSRAGTAAAAAAAAGIRAARARAFGGAGRTARSAPTGATGMRRFHSGGL